MFWGIEGVNAAFPVLLLMLLSGIQPTYVLQAELAGTLLSFLLIALLPRLRPWGLLLFYGVLLLTTTLASQDICMDLLELRMPAPQLLASFSLRWSIGCMLGIVIYGAKPYDPTVSPITRHISCWLTALPLAVTLVIYAIKIWMIPDHFEHFSLGPAHPIQPLLATGLVFLTSSFRERQAHRYEPFFTLSLGSACSLVMINRTVDHLSGVGEANTAMLWAQIPYLSAIISSILRYHVPVQPDRSGPGIRSKTQSASCF